MAFAYYNGVFGDFDDIKIPLSDRSVFFGDGIYDVASVRKGVCFALEDHLNRFCNNAKKLRLNLCMTKEELRSLCLNLVSRLDSDVDEAVLYFQASRGTAPRDHSFPEHAKANLYFTLKPTVFKKMGREVSAIMVEDIRFLMCDIKTLNLLPNVLAQQKAKEAGCYEAILHRGDRVTEGSHSGVSILKDGVFYTPPADHFILPSITRKHMLELCAQEGIPSVEKVFSVEELLNADEVIIMSTTALVNRCTVIDNKSVGGKDPKTLERLISAYRQKILVETES